MPEDLNASLDHKNFPIVVDGSIGTGTPHQRHIGEGVAIALMLTALFVIALLDHYGVIH